MIVSNAKYEYKRFMSYLTFYLFIINIHNVYFIFILNMNDDEWKKHAKNMLKAELQRRGISYEMLVDKLKAMGVEENYNSVNTKLNRGAFSFVFALQCLKAMDAKEIRLD